MMRLRPKPALLRTAFSIPRLSTVLLSVLILAVLGVGSWQSLFIPIDFDEAYNLQMVDLLSKGQGYATYGALKGSGRWLFDPHITTGPVILAPLAALWAASQGSVTALRWFMLSFAWLYIIGLVLLVGRHRSAGAWPAALAAGFALCVSHLQIGLVLGEVPAAAALVWAAWLMGQQRLLGAALLAGLAVQIKLVFGLPALILLLTGLAWQILSGKPVPWRRWLLAGVLFAAPSLAFEFWRLLSLGSLQAYWASVDELREFLRQQNINQHGTWLAPVSLGTKFQGLFQALPSSGWLAAGLGLVGLLFGPMLPASQAVDVRHDRTDAATPHAAMQQLLLAGLMVAGIAMLVGWVTKSAQPAARQALPFLMLAVPAMGALAGAYFMHLWAQTQSRRHVRWLLAAVCLLWSGLVLAALYKNVQTLATNQVGVVFSEEQKRVVEVLRKEKPDSMFVDGWWQNPEYQVLAGVRGLPWRSGGVQVMVVQEYQVKLLGASWDTYKRKCSEILYESPLTLVCRLPRFEYREPEFQVLDWGPRSTKAGQVPNQQSDGQTGMWIKIRKVDVDAVGPIRVFFGTTACGFNQLQPDGEVIVTTVPPHLFKRPGEEAVTILHEPTGRRFEVGKFVVKE